MIIHVVGPSQGYLYQLRDNYDPTTSAKFAKDVPVGYLTKSMTKAQINTIVSAIPIDNSTQEFNCQLWIGDALQKLVDADCLDNATRTAGINGMVDATLEAKDD